MKSILPARGLTAVAACASALAGAADASAQSAPTGGFSSTPPALPAPAAKIAMAPDGRSAIAPAGAPAVVAKAVAAANRLTRKPYKWGGGHGRWRDTGYDCSGTVSYVLHAAGLLDTPRNSTGFMSFGQRGRGRWITVFAHGGHAYMKIAGLRFDTSGAGEEGPRWRLEPRRPAGFVKRHPAGL